MERPSQLENFLNSHHSEGRLIDEGSFTLAKEKALSKLASYRLPFEGAWSVKVVQAAVSGGCCHAIDVEIGRKESRFTFQAPPEWTPDALETYFFTPEPGTEDSLNHLTSALWTVGVGRKHGFQLSVPGEIESLLWDGEALHRVEGEMASDLFTLTVRNAPRSQGPHLTGSSRWNADTVRALATRCYTCPVPLKVDGRRLDGLQFCPSHGWSSNTFPLAYAFLPGELQSLPAPPGTFEAVTGAQMSDSGGAGLGAASARILENLKPQENTSVLAILSAHIRGSSDKKAKIPFEPRSHAHTCYFVHHGVVASQLPFTVSPSHCSVAAFVNAEGMSTDISGFYLNIDSEGEERCHKCARVLTGQLRAVGLEARNLMSEEATKTPRRVGGAFVLLGLGLTFLSPFHGVPLMLAGVLAITEGPKARVEWAKKFTDGIFDLSVAWERAYSGSDPAVSRSP